VHLACFVRNRAYSEHYLAIVAHDAFSFELLFDLIYRTSLQKRTNLIETSNMPLRIQLDRMRLRIGPLSRILVQRDGDQFEVD